MYSFPSTSHTWLPRPRSRKMGATPWTNWVWPLLNVCVHDGMTLLARAKYSRDFANERSAVGSMASLSPPLGHDAVRPYRLRVAFVARRAAVDRLELGLALQKREDVVHAERLAQATVDGPNELEVRGAVDGPAEVREVRFVLDIQPTESLRVPPDVRRDVLTLGGRRRFAPRALKRLEREHLGVETVGKCGRLRIARVIDRASRLDEPRDHETRDPGIEERAVGSHAHDDRDTKPARRLVEAVQDVFLAPGVGGKVVIRGESEDRFVRGLLRRRDDHPLDARDPPGAPHEAREHWLAGDVGERFAGEARRAHSRLHDRRGHCPIFTGRPSVADAFAAEGTSRIARPPAASSTGGSPAWMHRTKWRISSTNIWFRSVLIDSWKTSTRRSSLPYTATDCVMKSQEIGRAHV